MSTIPEQVTEVIELCVEHMKLLHEKLPAQFEGQMPGVKRIDDAQFVPWFFYEASKWPPVQPFRLQGMTVNSWVLGLPVTTNGDEQLRRFEDLTGVDMNWVRFAAGAKPRLRQQQRMVA